MSVVGGPFVSASGWVVDYSFEDFFADHAFGKEGADEYFYQDPTLYDDSSNGSNETKWAKEDAQKRCLCSISFGARIEAFA